MLNITEPADLEFLRSFALDHDFRVPVETSIAHAAERSRSKAGAIILENLQNGFMLHEAFLRLSSKRPDAWSDLVDLASLISLISRSHHPDHDPISYRVSAYVFSYTGDSRIDALKAVMKGLETEDGPENHKLLLLSARIGVESGSKFQALKSVKITDSADLEFLRAFAMDQDLDQPIRDSVASAAQSTRSRAGKIISDSVRTGSSLYQAFMKMSSKRADGWSDLVGLACLIGLVSDSPDPETDDVCFRVASYVCSCDPEARVDALKAVLKELDEEAAHEDRKLLLLAARLGVEIGERFRRLERLSS